ncbi:MAG: SPFH domain-containing protein [Prevotella sp.]|nr:SPFH domain-containing protein [Prevotella sp.]
MSIFGKNGIQIDGRAITDVIQNEGGRTRRDIIAWRDPHEDFNTNAVLIVNPGEEAVFVESGQVAGKFTTGRYELKTQNRVIIRSFKEAITGGKSKFPCRVFFISTEEFNVNWGTVQPIGYTCPVFGPGALLRGNGVYNVKVVDSVAFIQKILRDSHTYTADDLSRKLVEYIYTDVAEIFSNVLEEKQINAMEVSKSIRTIAEEAMPRVQLLLQPYGLQLLNMSVKLSMDEEQRQMYEQQVRLQRMTAQGAAQARVIEAGSRVEEYNMMGQAYQQIKGMEIMKDMVNNPNGSVGGEMAGAGVGIGMAAATAGTFAGVAQQVFGQQQQPYAQPQQPYAQPQQPYAQPQQPYAQPQQPYAQPQQAYAQPQQQTPQADPIQSLQKMKQMLTAGLITQQQYDAKVAEIMARL